MRNCSFVILFTIALCPRILLGSDTILINENFENVSLKEVLQTLKSKYQLRIAFSDKYVRDIAITVNLKDQSVHDSFEQILANTGLTFELIEGNAIIIKKGKVSSVVEALDYFELSGVVMDAGSGERLPYAYVWMEPDQKNISTNAEGYFSIPNATTSTKLNISYLGYKDTLVFVTKDFQTRRLQIDLQPKRLELEEVIVSSEEVDDFKPDEQAGKITVNPKMAQQIPSIGEVDVFRSLQLLPGVNATNEVSSGLNINGGTSNQNLVLFDGFTVYHVDHFFGYFSAFNPMAIKSLRLYKGGFESKYGGRSSSVVDISGKDGNRNKTSGSLGLNLLSVNTSIEVPLSDNGTTLFFSGRRSYTDIWKSSLFEDIFSIFESSLVDDQTGAMPGTGRRTQSEVVPDFYYTDLNLKLSSKIGAKNHLSFSFYDSNDILNYTESTESDFRDTLNVVTDNLGVINWGNVGTSMNFSRQWNNKHFTSALLSYSFYESTFKEQSTSTSESNTSGTFVSNTSQDQLNNIEDFSIKLDHEWELGNSNKLESGIMTSRYSNQLRYEANDSLLVDERVDNAWLLSHYLQGTFALAPSLAVTPGLRSDYLSTTNKFYFEPRLSFTYKVNDRIQLKGATGSYYQFINQSNTTNVLEGSRDFWIVANGKNVPVQQAWHGLLGADYHKNGLTVSVNYFHKQFDGLLEYAFQNGGLITQFEDSQQVFAMGEGTSQGMEFMVKRDFGRLSSWASYTLSQVRHTFPKLNGGRSFYANHDQRHEFNWFGVYSLNHFELSATWIYGSGKPFSALSGVELQNPGGNNGPPISTITVTEKNGLRLPVYHRLDINAKYKFNLGKTKASVALSIFNLYNRRNILDKKISVVAPGDPGKNRKPIVALTDVPLMGITPNISFGIEF